MEAANQFDTLFEAITALRELGYERDFNAEADALVCAATGNRYLPENFEVTSYHRFEGSTDPADESVLYAISSAKGPEGLLVNAYGVYADGLSDRLVEKLRIS